MDLAQINRAHLPRWLNIIIYMMAEASIVCTDIGQVRFASVFWRSLSDVVSYVIGTAIAINILDPKIPLMAGCAISVADTLFILLFYKPDGTIRRIRAFEVFVSIFVIGSSSCSVLNCL
jgi:metal iron transporter